MCRTEAGPAFVSSVKHGSQLGLSMACASNGFLLTKPKLEEILPHLTYLRVNISAGEPKRYAEIMGCKEKWFDRVVQLKSEKHNYRSLLYHQLDH